MIKTGRVLKQSDYGLIPLVNFGVLFSNMQLFRSAQPLQKFQYEWLAKTLKIKSIINLREEIDIDEKMIGEAGIPFHFTIQVKDHQPPKMEDAMQFYHLIRECPKPALIHCAHGHGRTSTFSVIAKMAYGMTFEDAMKDEKERFHYEWRHHLQEEFLYEFDKHLKQIQSNGAHS